VQTPAPLGPLLGVPLLILAACASAPRGTAGIAPFHSDGCSLFPDGRPEQPALWCDCCLAHDLAYWRGGTEAERLKADRALRECVLERTQNPVTAQVVYAGVRAGGGPAFPTWYRWSYGWPFGRGYRALSPGERAAADEEETAYRALNPRLQCRAGSRSRRPVGAEPVAGARRSYLRARTGWVRRSPRRR